MGVGVTGSRKVIVSHPTGNTNVTAVVNALKEAELLEAFYTCLMWRPESTVARLMPGGLRATMQRRARLQLPSELVRTRPARELVRNFLIRSGKKHWITRESSAFSIDSVYRDLDKVVAREMGRYRDAGAVYAYDDGALYHFRRAPEFGLHRIYDLPIGYWRANQQISQEEAERKPEWKGTLNSLADSAEKCARKDEELELADTIAVPSTFVKKTLDLFPGAKKRIVVNPFGVPANIAAPREKTSKSDPLRVLYVGSLTQRKGIAYLFDAVEKAGKAVTLTVIGRKVGQSDALDRACAKHRWISSVPHTEILAEMRRHDVFVFPSLFEGLALVNGEAVSQGLPVITTPNSGGTDILRDGLDGFVVPIRDADAIAERLLQFHDDRELLKRMSDSALEQALALDWSGYKQRTVAMVREVLG
jgi:glycosyltransferase involved in cell wall biosynthesis